MTEERWEGMDSEERFEAIRKAISGYIESGIDGARYEDRVITLCSGGMFMDLVNAANLQWWMDNAREHGLSITGWRYRSVDIYQDDTNAMTLEDYEWLCETCRRLMDYPLIGEEEYLRLEEEAFVTAFEEEYMAAGDLKEEYRDIGLDRMRELAWEHG